MLRRALHEMVIKTLKITSYCACELTNGQFRKSRDNVNTNNIPF